MNTRIVVKGVSVILFLALVLLGVLFRTVWHLGENIEFVTSSTLLSASYLGLGWAIFTPVVIMFISDLILGNTSIFIFTWSAYMIVGVMGFFGFSMMKKSSVGFKIVMATGLAAVASIWFYLWTNFGVWLLDSWGMYPKTLVGLIDAYIMGLPFLKINLLGNLVFVPVSFFIAEIAKSFYPIFRLLHPFVRFTSKSSNNFNN